MKRMMMLIIGISALSLANLQGQNPKDVKEFFLYLKMAGVHNDLETLKELVYPLTDNGEDVQAAIIHNILNPSEAQRGDGAFSYRALDSLRENSSRTMTINDELYATLVRDPFFGKVFEKHTQNDILVFDYKNAHVILVKGEIGLQLLFWENLNQLLR